MGHRGLVTGAARPPRPTEQDDRVSSRQVHDIGRRRAWVVWLVALSVYVLAVFNRSSLGVAGLLAADRFDISATQLAAFTVLQLLVYAGMQVPVGVAGLLAADRFDISATQARRRPMSCTCRELTRSCSQSRRRRGFEARR